MDGIKVYKGDKMRMACTQYIIHIISSPRESTTSPVHFRINSMMKLYTIAAVPVCRKEKVNHCSD